MGHAKGFEIPLAGRVDAARYPDSGAQRLRVTRFQAGQKCNVYLVQQALKRTKIKPAVLTAKIPIIAVKRVVMARDSC